MSVYTDYFGMLPQGSVQSLETAVRRSTQWREFYRGPGVTIYELLPLS
jgi:hypothetical protein